MVERGTVAGLQALPTTGAIPWGRTCRWLREAMPLTFWSRWTQTSTIAEAGCARGRIRFCPLTDRLAKPREAAFLLAGAGLGEEPALVRTRLGAHARASWKCSTCVTADGTVLLAPSRRIDPFQRLRDRSQTSLPS